VLVIILGLFNPLFHRRSHKKMIESSERIIREQNNNNPAAVNKHFELQIKTLQNAARDADKLEALL
jgi:hypothetical protein